MNPKDLQTARNAFKKLLSSTLESSWSCVGSSIGAYNKAWAASIRRRVEKEVGLEGEKLGIDVIKALLEKAGEDMKLMKFVEGPAPLSEFSQVYT